MNRVPNTAAGGEGAHTQQFLTFELAGQEYGVGILQVQEIRGWSEPTVIPHSPPWLLGVIDLRGAVVPVIDMRRRLAVSAAEIKPSTVVIVIRIGANQEERNFGLVVDAVSDVYDIDEAALRALPELGNRAAGELVRGLAQVDGKTLILLNAERLAVTVPVN
jgi:purine-binding chemotaxis protein CheW